jgi:hypothetical protein
MGDVARITCTSAGSCNSSDASLLDSAPNNLLTVVNTLDSLPCASCPFTPNWKTILSCSAAIKAEVRSRVYWTNVSVDPKVSVNITCQAAQAASLFSKFTKHAAFSLIAIADFNPLCPRSKCVSAHVIT